MSKSTVKEPSSLEIQPRKRFIDARDKHTGRNKGCRDNSLPVVSCTKKHIDIADNAYVVQETILDTVLDSYDVSEFSYDDHIISLNHNKNWKYIPELLEANYIRKRYIRSTNIYGHKKTIEYTLPIIGERLVVNQTNQIVPKSKILVLNGKKYNTKFLYRCRSEIDFIKHDKFELVDIEKLGLYEVSIKSINVHGSTHGNNVYGNVKSYCTAINRNRIKDNYTNYYHAVESYSISNSLYNLNNYDNYRINKGNKGNTLPLVKHTDIDLSKDTLITHISTMGKMYDIYTFPTWEQCKKYGLDYSFYTSVNKISYIKENDKCYVIKYKLLVRKHSEKRWISLGSFTGNNNRTTEVLHKFDEPITVQYIRIIPESYVGLPIMQVALYSDKASTNKATIDNNQNSIIYTINNPSNKRYVISYKSLDKRDTAKFNNLQRVKNRTLMRSLEIDWNSKNENDELYIYKNNKKRKNKNTTGNNSIGDKGKLLG